jgi:hypothetical protein
MYSLRRLINERTTNGYSWPILSKFRSGMDLQCVVNAYGAACYILGYTAKAEMEAFNQMLQRAMRETDGMMPETKQQVYAMGLKLLRARRVGMHEAAFRLCSFPYKLDSRDFVWIPAYPPDQRTWFINVRKARDNPEPQEPMLIALYRKRPKVGTEMLILDGASERSPVPWSEMCLKTFGMWVYKDLEVPILSNGDHLRVRARAAIITIPHFSIEEHDKYYYQQLLLYKPWYDEAELVPSGKGPLDAFVEAHAAGRLKIPASGQVDSRHTIDDLLNYVEALRFTRSKQKSVPLPNLDDPGAESCDELEENGGADARASSAAASLSKLSHQQRQMVQVVCTHDSQPQHLESPLMVLFSGEGGTGKSFVLKALVHTLNFKHEIASAQLSAWELLWVAQHMTLAEKRSITCSPSQ